MEPIVSDEEQLQSPHDENAEAAFAEKFALGQLEGAEAQALPTVQRDDRGRFAAKETSDSPVIGTGNEQPQAPPAQAPQEAAPEQTPEGQIPQEFYVKRRQAEREQRKSQMEILEAQLRETQAREARYMEIIQTAIDGNTAQEPQPDPNVEPDPTQDPEGYLAWYTRKTAQEEMAPLKEELEKRRLAETDAQDAVRYQQEMMQAQQNIVNELRELEPHYISSEHGKGFNERFNQFRERQFKSFMAITQGDQRRSMAMCQKFFLDLAAAGMQQGIHPYAFIDATISPYVSTNGGQASRTPTRAEVAVSSLAQTAAAAPAASLGQSQAAQTGIDPHAAINHLVDSGADTRQIRRAVDSMGGDFKQNIRALWRAAEQGE